MEDEHAIEGSLEIDMSKLTNIEVEKVVRHMRSNKAEHAIEGSLEIDMSKLTNIEVEKVVRHMRSNKAAGVDEISSELWKADIRSTTDILAALLKDIWESEQIPTQWKAGVIVKIPKKDDAKICENWRGVMHY
ncbi:hypothetical protein QE152_g35809 [Popillia japonica]|uniref:Reverse transcriptase n=1 Tax=Popillia japonica TaxID=7064 RepID=A0AAW1IEQ7_POPJA